MKYALYTQPEDHKNVWTLTNMCIHMFSLNKKLSSNVYSEPLVYTVYTLVVLSGTCKKAYI